MGHKIILYYLNLPFPLRHEKKSFQQKVFKERFCSFSFLISVIGILVLNRTRVLFQFIKKFLLWHSQN
ncbi:hypothetical protein DQM68_16130 [Leptospira mayottensis]|uniref:Uncharacterized protein n=2 Tax=Leptospira mayottensis TaxID=1137606 RepID=A0AA87MQE1_9LEPT|nr:hypothetical protein DQM68_16130 [Leptospira mayottensis]AZQ01575.1 hypothetical protein LEP1GSC190_05590 [Leptospira mayottensis 200901116]EKS00464.1 hypothetical protein LEP1GSC125_4085 [Leptospira mayottensis 200901122]AXR65887.1 hypothetical protein DQM28_18465 [Leptospira mayottensis]AXR69556.1 hypothetical protein DPV73_17605 [Leptospira mayottensis]